MNNSSYIPPVRKDADPLLQRDLREVFLRLQEIQRMLTTAMGMADFAAKSNVAGLELQLDANRNLNLNLVNRDDLRTTLFVDTISTRKSNLGLTSTAPTATDDSGKGYSVGSIWTTTGSNNVYLCANATVGAAVWRQLN